MVVQSLLFDKRWTQEEVKAWLRHHGYKVGLDIKLKYYRARQLDPKSFRRTTFRTIHFSEGIEAVVGKLKG